MKNGNVCIAIPVTKIKTTIMNAKESVEKGADLLEFRLDYLSDISELTQSTFQKLCDSVKIPVILTLRQHAEGGQMNTSILPEEKRISIIRQLISIKPAFVDVEARLDHNILTSLNELGEANGVELIYSYHDFKKTPSYDDILNVALDFEEKCPGIKSDPTFLDLISDADERQNILKMIFYANLKEDAQVPYALCDYYSKKQMRIVSFCMGKNGEDSRKKCLSHNAFFTFASLHEPTAPGQIKIDEF